MTEMPLFVKIEQYKDVVDIVHMIKSKIEDAKRTLSKINELRNEENAELEQWHQAVEDVEKKVEFIDQTLSSPETM